MKEDALEDDEKRDGMNGDGVNELMDIMHATIFVVRFMNIHHLHLFHLHYMFCKFC